jgi:hypothetical protein
VNLSSLAFKTFKICLPFHGKKVLFLGVAFLAAGNHISLGASSAPDQRHHMIHGQFPGGYASAAIVAETFCKLSFPPLGLPKLSGLIALPANILVVPVIW